MANIIYGDAPAFSYRQGPNVAIAPGGIAKLTVGTVVDFDTTGAVANNRFLPKIAGYYLITALAGASEPWSSAGAFSSTFIFKNGSNIAAVNWDPGANYTNGGLSGLVLLNGSSDYIEIYGQQNSAATRNISLVWFSGVLVRSLA